MSTGAQDEQLQRSGILRKAAADGVEIVKWYELRGDSAWSGEQDSDLKLALDDAGNRIIQVLYCFKSDRLERRGIEAMFRLRRELKDRGAKAISVTEPWFEEEGVNAEVMIAMGAAMAKQESDIKSDRQLLLTIPEIRKNGAWYGRIPWGFETAGPKFGKKLVPTALGLEIMPQIFERVIARESLASICHWLDSLRIREKPWWPVMVMRMIRNPAYIGYVVFNEDRPADSWVHQCDAMIDARTFRLANEVLSDKASKQRGPRGCPGRRAMLKGAIRCPRCGSPMYRIDARPTSKKGREHERVPYYRCSGTGPLRKGCGNMVLMDLVDVTVSKIMAATWHAPVILPVLVRGTDHDAELNAIEVKLRQLPALGLSRAEEQAERELLWAEEDRIRGLPVEDDRWEQAATGELWSDLYAAEPVPSRGQWLSGHGFTVCACKDSVTVSQIDAAGNEVTWTEPLHEDGSPAGPARGERTTA